VHELVVPDSGEDVGHYFFGSNLSSGGHGSIPPSNNAMFVSINVLPTPQRRCHNRDALINLNDTFS
jgi:hypothetical protein